MGSPALKLVVPAPDNGTVDQRRPPRRRPNSETRSREYLTPDEVERLMKAAKKLNRYGHRDATMILIASRHGLRPTELVRLRWDQFDLAGARMHVNRLKKGNAGAHPLSGPELRSLRQWQREQDPRSPFVFTSERDAPITAAGFFKMVARLGVAAGFAFPIHPHMLRHACGFKHANDGKDTRTLQEFLGHRSIGNTVVYTALASGRFKDFCED